MKLIGSLLILLFVSTHLQAQDQGLVDIDRESTLLPGRIEIEVSAVNPSNSWIHCDLIRSPVNYRSSQAGAPWQETLITRNVWLPPSSTKTFRAGRDKTEGLRKLGIYPDAEIDTVDNSLLSSNTRCTYKEPGVAEVKAGSLTTCSLHESGDLKCWGWNIEGALGNGRQEEDRFTPAQSSNIVFPNNRPVKRLASGNPNCAITDDNKLFCWGGNHYGQLGTGDTKVRFSPQEIDLGGRTALRVSAGSSHSCAILDDQSVKCWGRNAKGQLGYGDHNSRTKPEANPINLGGKALEISVEDSLSCAILEGGSVKCWGAGWANGYDDAQDRSKPDAQPVNLGGAAKSIWAAFHSACAELTNGTIKCWGEKVGHNAPAAVIDLGGQKLRNFSMHFTRACAALDNNTVKCWNYESNSSWLADEIHSVNPEAGQIKSVSAGNRHACAISEDSKLLCYGYLPEIGGFDFAQPTSAAIFSP